MKYIKYSKLILGNDKLLFDTWTKSLTGSSTSSVKGQLKKDDKSYTSKVLYPILTTNVEKISNACKNSQHVSRVTFVPASFVTTDSCEVQPSVIALFYWRWSIIWKKIVLEIKRNLDLSWLLSLKIEGMQHFVRVSTKSLFSITCLCTKKSKLLNKNLSDVKVVVVTKIRSPGKNIFLWF